MKFYLNKLIVSFLLIVFIFTLGQTKEAFAQLTGGGSKASGLEGSVSGTLNGKVGTSIFKRLTQPSTTKKPIRKRSTSSTNSGASQARKRATPINKQKPSVKNKPIEIDDEEYADYAVLNYIPVGNLNTAQKLANQFSDDQAERKMMIDLFKVVKIAYDQEAAKKGKKNDVALALTFFIATTVTVYNDVPEPGDPAFDNLYETLADALVDDEDFANSSDSLKQETSETLVYISGLILGGYMNGKESGDPNTITIFRQLAGISLLSLTQIDPAKMSFDQNGLVVLP